MRVVVVCDVRRLDPGAAAVRERGEPDVRDPAVFDQRLGVVQGGAPVEADPDQQHVAAQVAQLRERTPRSLREREWVITCDIPRVIDVKRGVRRSALELSSSALYSLVNVILVICLGRHITLV